MRQAVWQLDCKISMRKARSWTKGPPIPWAITVRGPSAAMALEAALDTLVGEYPDYVSPEDIEPDPLTEKLLAEWQAKYTARREETVTAQAPTGKSEPEGASKGSPGTSSAESVSGSPSPRCRRRWTDKLSDTSSDDSGPSSPPGDLGLRAKPQEDRTNRTRHEPEGAEGEGRV